MAGYSPTGLVGEPISEPNLIEALRDQRRHQREVLKSSRSSFEKQRQQFEKRESFFLSNLQDLENALDLLSKPNLTSLEIAYVFKIYRNQCIPQYIF